MLTFKPLFILCIGAFGKTGINCFVLITGYFMCKSSITLRKFVKLLFEVEFYNIIIYFIFVIAGLQPFSVRSLMHTVLPITYLGTNFVGCYLLFFLLIPFLNILIKNINERQHALLLTLLIGIYSFWGTLPTIAIVFNYISWFIIIYLVGSYISMYRHKIFDSTIIWGFVTLIVLFVSVLSIIVIAWRRVAQGSTMDFYYFLVESNKILAVALSVSAFLWFKNIKIKKSKFVNRVSASTFGVLLIHANSDAMRSWLWGNALNNKEAYISNYWFIHAVGSVLGIYVICTVIDILRIQLIEKNFLKLWDKFYERFCISLKRNK